MNKSKIFTLTLPKNKDGIDKVETRKSIMFIGANGSGKTRLGAWVEMESLGKANTHRVSAQKLLNMPDTIIPSSMKIAKAMLFGGHQNALEKENYSDFKSANRWNQNPNISTLNDFNALGVFLFSDHMEAGAEYLKSSKETGYRVEPPITLLEQVKKL